MNIDCISVSDKRGLERVYVLLNSIKRIKKPDTTINYRLVIEDVDDRVREYFSDLESDDFKIQYIDTQWFKERINPPHRNYFYYVRLLFPVYFTDIDRILYLDTDLVFIKEGIEDLWNVDLSNKCVAAVTDIPVNVAQCLKTELNQTKTKDYFNSGVLLMNLKRMRDTGKARQLVRWCFSWDRSILNPLIMDQTLMNYLFRDDVVYMQYKYNDYSLMFSLGVLDVCKRYLKLVYGYEEPTDSIKDAIVMHFLGELKPWEEDDYRAKLFPYRNTAKNYWNQIFNKLGKKWEIQQ